jgi:hypothetical protein
MGLTTPFSRSVFMAKAKPYEPTVAEILAWMREIRSPSWAATVRSVEYAISELKEEARRERRRLSAAARRRSGQEASAARQ